LSIDVKAVAGVIVQDAIQVFERSQNVHALRCLVDDLVAGSVHRPRW
jgi:hypothetical protein